MDGDHIAGNCWANTCRRVGDVSFSVSSEDDVIKPARGLGSTEQCRPLNIAPLG